jgi:hypothetical protein
MNANHNLLDRVDAWYDIDLGVTANISDVATARLLLNAGNYLNGYLNGRVSQVSPFINTGIEGKSLTGANNFTVENVTPYYLYLETPLKIAGAGTQLTVGKFGHQFTPYTLKMADVDSYFYNDKTDLGDYPITGARLNFRALGLNFSAYAGVSDTSYAQLTSTAGNIGIPGLYAGNLAGTDNTKFQPQGGFGPFLPAAVTPALAMLTGPGGFAPGFAPYTVGIGGTTLEQSAGVRASYVAKKFQVGATYLVAAGESADTQPAAVAAFAPGPADLFRQLSVYGADFNIQPVRWLGLSGSVTESQWNSRISGLGDPSHELFGISENERLAYDLRVKIPISRAQVALFWKRIGTAFDAPGYWGRMGDWINPRGIEGFGGNIEIPLVRRLVFYAEGADYNYFDLHESVGPAGAAAGLIPTPIGSSDLLYANAGIRFPLSSRNSVDLGYELANYRPNSAAGGATPGLKRLEQYYNVGFAHQFNPGLSWRLLYQFMDFHSGGFFDAPGFHYTGAVLATQVQLRF